MGGLQLVFLLACTAFYATNAMDVMHELSPDLSVADALGEGMGRGRGKRPRVYSRSSYSISSSSSYSAAGDAGEELGDAAPGLGLGGDTAAAVADGVAGGVGAEEEEEEEEETVGYTGPFSMLQVTKSDQSDTTSTGCDSTCAKCSIVGSTDNGNVPDMAETYGTCTECNTDWAFFLWKNPSTGTKTGFCKQPSLNVQTRCIKAAGSKEFSEVDTNYICTKASLIEIPVKLDSTGQASYPNLLGDATVDADSDSRLNWSVARCNVWKVAQCSGTTPPLQCITRKQVKCKDVCKLEDFNAANPEDSIAVTSTCTAAACADDMCKAAASLS